MLRRSPNRALQVSGGCPWVSGRADRLYHSWKGTAKRDLTVGAFFQNRNTGSASPPHSLAVWFVEGLSAKALNGTITEGNSGKPRQPGTLKSPGCLRRGWSDAGLKLLCSVVGSGSISAVFVLLQGTLTLLRGLRVAQACGRHSQGLSSFLWAGSSLYLASYALKHWLVASHRKWRI